MSAKKLNRKQGEWIEQNIPAEGAKGIGKSADEIGCTTLADIGIDHHDSPRFRVLGELIKVEQAAGRLATSKNSLLQYRDSNDGITDVKNLQDYGLTAKDSFRAQELAEHKDIIAKVLVKTREELRLQVEARERQAKPDFHGNQYVDSSKLRYAPPDENYQKENRETYREHFGINPISDEDHRPMDRQVIGQIAKRAGVSHDTVWKVNKVKL